VLGPCQAGIFCQGGLVVKPLDLPDFGQDACGINRSDAWDGLQCVRNAFKMAGNGFIELFELRLQAAD